MLIYFVVYITDLFDSFTVFFMCWPKIKSKSEYRSSLRLKTDSYRYLISNMGSSWEGTDIISFSFKDCAKTSCCNF